MDGRYSRNHGCLWSIKPNIRRWIYLAHFAFRLRPYHVLLSVLHVLKGKLSFRLLSKLRWIFQQPQTGRYGEKLVIPLIDSILCIDVNVRYGPENCTVVCRKERVRLLKLEG